MTHRITRSRCALVALAVAAGIALPTGAQAAPTGWEGYDAGQVVLSGSYSVTADGVAKGTLPPGYTADAPPSDPSDPELADAVEEATQTSALKTAALPAIAARSGRPRARAADQPHAGCVTAISVIGPDGLSYKGQMAGCRRGHLWLHTLLRADGVGVSDYPPLDCYNTTECSVPYRTYTGQPHCREFINYAHGWNRTSGNQDTAWQLHLPWYC